GRGRRLGRLGRHRRGRRRLVQVLFGTLFAQVEFVEPAVASDIRDVVGVLFRTPLTLHRPAPRRPADVPRRLTVLIVPRRGPGGIAQDRPPPARRTYSTATSAGKRTEPGRFRPTFRPTVKFCPRPHSVRQG